jgi:2,3-bisphosphoglycerate-independent phosphoglycerate mutase
MAHSPLISLLRPDASPRMLLWVFDGIGGLPHPAHGLKTELEAARTPALDALAARSACGALQMAGPGVAVGSGAGHLALFGHDTGALAPVRGVLEVLGSTHGWRADQRVDPSLSSDAIAARGNFACLRREDDGRRVIADRRANDVTDAECDALCRLLSAQIRVEGVSLTWLPGRQHRFSLILHAHSGPALDPRVTDADPQASGLPPLLPVARVPEAARAAEVLCAVLAAVEALLDPDPRADTILLRGCASAPVLPSFEARYGLNAAALATYPMYRGVARLAGMHVLPDADDTPMERIDRLEAAFHAGFELVYFHVKETDEWGHKGDFLGKVEALERWDAPLARALALPWDVVAVTGDHCTPTLLAEHSWHPVPLALWSSTAMAGDTPRLTERLAMRGVLGLRPATDLLPLMLAEARCLRVFGA